MRKRSSWISSSSSEIIDNLLAEKEQAVANEDFLKAHELKKQIDRIRASSSSPPIDDDEPSLTAGIALDLENSIELHQGDYRFPPMSEVPCTLKGSFIQKLIKPKDADMLWQWYESMGNLEGDPSWAELWPSASSLAASLVNRKDMIQGETVFELGAGLGAAGLVAASLGAKQVVLMDREPYALHCAMSSASINNLTNVQAAVVDWSSPDFQEQYSNSAGVILGSDILYDPETVDALANLISDCSQESGGRMWVTDPKIERVQGLRKKFVDALESTGAVTSILDLPKTPVYGSCYTETSEPDRTVLIEAVWGES